MKEQKGYTLFMSREEHKSLKRIAVEEEKTLHDVIMYALDLAYPDWRAKKEKGLA